MKRPLAMLVLVAAIAALSGCYYDPGYSYVRGGGYGGDAYYGDGGSDYVVVPDYYGGYYDGYYGGYYGGYGCCYAPGVSVGVGSVWYSDRYRYRGDYRDYRDYRGHAGQWQGRRDDGGHQGHGQWQPPAGGHGGRDGNRGHRGRDDDDRH